MIQVAVFDTKPYDRRYLETNGAARKLTWKFHEFRLGARTAPAAEGAQAICAFVNDSGDEATLEILQRLGVRLIALRCAGYNNVDLAAAKALGITVTRVPAYSPHAVAEHAVALLLTLNRKIHRAYNRVREHNFSLNGLVGFDISGKTVGLIGTGRIGRVTAEILRGFQARVLVHDSYPAPDWAGQHGIEYTDLQSVLRSSDIISLHVPLLPSTFHLLNAETFSLVKPGAFLINTSRGKLIETKALIEALKTNRLGGVALDVYEEEEGIFFEDLSEQVFLNDDLSSLLTFPNVLITSHQAFLTHEALTEIARVTIENICRFAAKQDLLSGTAL